MALTLYNSLTRQKEEFVPIEEGHVGIYVCGPTVYGPPHLGHAKSYITFDVLVKHLRNSGLKVRYVQNITDVGHLTDDADSGEDKIQRQARIDKVHPWEIVDKWTRQYMNDMEKLHVDHPNFYVRASQHIGEQIEAVKALVDKGVAYEIDGNVYFSVESFPEYGKLSGRKLDDQKEGVRVESRTDKKNPRDFALWKKAEPGHILKWNSPWGEGYPGWHIECSVMATKYLGKTIDIHGGGLENKFPHHECEIAQSESLNECPFCRYWVHNNMVTVDGIKMGKSLGNFKTCEDLLSRHSPEAIRAFILTTHYRSPSNYTEEAIEATATGLSRLAQLQMALQEVIEKQIGAGTADNEAIKLCEEVESKIVERLDDDIDTPGAIAALYSFVTDANKFISSSSLSSSAAEKLLALIQKWGKDILGILPPATEKTSDLDIAPVMEMIIGLRNEMKAAKKFDVADSIRDRLKESGILIEDTREGTRWKRA
ncbi:MAG: cysteinyl-tRNA synthetase [Clostridiales bacterium]|jgi:cysteinyl-tRNA synthetase|nr:cysteinyl-tRNA synthetase [Clostridiales bacterium]MDN5282723.1 cysteinyl-tRNA synthetase [Candidatus Ozemobacter sp.]